MKRYRFLVSLFTLFMAVVVCFAQTAEEKKEATFLFTAELQHLWKYDTAG